MAQKASKVGLIPWHQDYRWFSFKYQLFIEQIRSSSLPIDIVTINQHIAWEDIERVVKKSFLSKLRDKFETERGQYRGTAPPALYNVFHAVRLYCQGTYLGIKEVLSGNYQFAFNCIGGAHHAGPNFAGGGNIINDMAVGIYKLRTEGNSSRFCIIDCDYHAHDGTLAHFGGDPSVFTVSIHPHGWVGGEKDNEGWGEGMDSNISWEVKDPISGTEYLAILQDEIFPHISNFKPDLIVFLNGVDSHEEDPVTSKYMRRPFSLSDDNFKELADTVAEFALEQCEGKIVALGAGGYSEKITARIWYQTVQRFVNKLC